MLAAQPDRGVPAAPALLMTGAYVRAGVLDGARGKEHHHRAVTEAGLEWIRNEA